MLRSCGKCGRMHNYGQQCPVKPRIARAQTQDQKLRSTSRWQNKREEIKDASKWLCAVCLDLDGRYNYNNLEVHHITKLKDNADGLLDNYNLVCLCKQHHELADAGKIDAEYLRGLASKREKAR